MEQRIEKRTLGRTGIEVTCLGFGGAAMGGMYADISDDAARQLVTAAFEKQINFFDTAPLYGYGKSEQRFGSALKHLPRDEFVLSTKVGRLLQPLADDDDRMDIFVDPPPFSAPFDFSYDATMRSLEDSLGRLQLDRIDIVLIHDPDDHFQEAIDGAYRALHELREQGVVKAIGAGMNQWEMLAEFARQGDFDVFLLAGRYTLLEQTPLETFFPLIEEKNIGIILGGTYNSGILAGGKTYNYNHVPEDILEKVRQLSAVAERHSVSLKAAACQFCLAHPAVAAIIPSTLQEAELLENIDLINQQIPADFWRELKALALIDETAPVPEAK